MSCEAELASASPGARNGTLVDVDGMAAIVAVIGAGSFTAAARRLGVSKSVMSRRVSSMEEQLGTHLIDRTATGVNPTEVGAIYYAKCVRILESIEAANDFASSFHGGIRGSVQVSVPRFLCASVVAPLLVEFANSYPELRVEVEVDELESSLRDSGFDVAVRIGRLADSSMLARTISTSRSWVCASPEYLQSHGEPTSPEHLERHDCLLRSSDGGRNGWRLLNGGTPCIYRVRERIRSACYFQLLEAARSGLGLALLPDYMIAGAVSRGELVVVLDTYAPPPKPISLVYQSSRKSSQKVQALIGFLAERIPGSGFGLYGLSDSRERVQPIKESSGSGLLK